MDQQVEEIAAIYSGLQKEICCILEQADGKAKFTTDKWEKEIGSGEACVIRDGAAIEKGGVNFSFVKGKYSNEMEQLLGEKAKNFAATGISSIMHPVNPLVPIIHMNVRFFALDNSVRWFGGGIDLTPHYVDEVEAANFHRHLKRICDDCNIGFYPRFKKWADDYFFIPHRNETRGIGGIFFDRLLPDEDVKFEQLLDFTKKLALRYAEFYSRTIKLKSQLPFNSGQKEWQELRRGRYAEFNLVYDRGTKFGFESNGNTESILVSLPPTSAWEYKKVIKENSEEEKTQRLLRRGIEWINL